MGDKSPKATRRQEAQKQVRNTAVTQRKEQEIAAKRAVFKK